MTLDPNGVKFLYKKSPVLAEKVTKALEVKLKGIAAKDPVSTKIASIINKVLGVKPDKIKVKKKNDITTYTWGELVDKKGTNKVVIKVTDKGNKWDFVVAIPNITSPVIDLTEIFLKVGTDTEIDGILEKLAKILKQAKNFLSIRDAVLNKNGDIIVSSISSSAYSLKKTLDVLYSDVKVKQEDYKKALIRLKDTIEKYNLNFITDVYENYLGNFYNFIGSLQNYIKGDLVKQVLLHEKVSSLSKLTPYGWVFKPGMYVKDDDGVFRTAAKFMRKKHKQGDPLIYVFSFSADSDSFHVAIVKNQQVVKENTGIPFKSLRKAIKGYSIVVKDLISN